VTFLTAEAFDFADRHAFHADFGEGFFYFLQFEGFDDGFDFFHDLRNARSRRRMVGRDREDGLVV
jgi:hypothetical protein